MTVIDIDRPRNKKSSADLGGRDDSLKPLVVTQEQEYAAASYVIEHAPDDNAAEELLEMLGLLPYESAKRSKTPRGGELVHGKRSTYVDYKCRCTDCNSANNAYLVARRAA